MPVEGRGPPPVKETAGRGRRRGAAGGAIHKAPRVERKPPLPLQIFGREEREKL